MAYTANQGAVISVSVDGAAASQRQIEGIAQSMSNLSSTVQSAMRNLAAGAGIGGGLVQVVQLSDEYTKLTSQLRLATDSTHAYAAAYAEVKRIATDAQADLGSTGMLYARIAKGTNELGIGQKRVADITEVVNLALKVSAATAEEAASANLQLSQAFASGALRGEEFNAVNEAAPRLMQALADGMGVPIGALKQMASDGLITSQVMADVLPKSLGQLRDEAKQVQTISGAFQVLKNNVLEFTATNAQANGSVAAITGGINLLANNLVVLVGALTTITAVKTVNWLSTWTTETYRKIAADQASRAAAVAAAQADLARIEATGAQAAATQAAVVIAREETVARLAQANANILAAKAAIEAATAAGVQSFALRTLRIATGELAQAEAVRGAALAELAVLGQQAARVSAQIAVAQTAEAAAARGVAAAQAAAGIGTGLASRALGLLGGPIGAVVTVLGVAATAWSWYQSRQQEANASAAQETEASTTEIIEQLNKQTAKLRERLELQKQLGVSPQETSPAADRAAAVLAQINDLTAKHTELTVAEQAQLYALGLEYNNLTVALQQNKAAKAETDATGKAAKDLIAVRERLTGVNKQYLEDLQTMQTALEKGAISQAEYVELVKKLAVETYKSSDAGKEATSAANKEKEAFASLISSIREKIDANRVELKVGEDATESQKATIKLDQELASGKLKLSAAHLARARAALVDLAVSEQALKLRDAERDVAKYILASSQARSLASATLGVEYSMYGKSADARELAMVKIRAEADQEKKLAEMRLAKKPITDQMIADLNAETKARIEAEQATLAQTKALGYAAQLAEENKRFGLEYIADDRARAAATLELDVQVWRERIALAGDGTEAQKRLQQEYDTWYRNQLMKPQLEEQKKVWGSIEQTAHDTFVSIFDSGKSAFDRLRDSLKNGLLDLLYQMTVKKWIINLQTSMSGTGGTAGSGGMGDLFGSSGSSGGGLGSAGSLISMANTAKNLYSSVSGGLSGMGAGLASNIGSGIQSVGSFFGSSNMTTFGQGMQGFGLDGSLGGLSGAGQSAGAMLGSAASILGGVAGGVFGGRAISGGYGSNGAVNTGTAVGAAVGSIVPVIGTALGALVGGLLGGAYNRLFGRKAPEIQSQGLRGTYADGAVSGNTYQNIIEKGGWFRSDKKYTESQKLTDDLVKQFTEGFESIKLVSAGFASSLGVSADALKDYSKAFDITLTKDEAKNKQAITDFFTTVGEEVTRKLVPGIDSLTKSGETASTALQRLAGEFQATDRVAQLLGRSVTDTWGALGLQSAAARERLLQLAGGADVLGQQASFFAQNFLSDAERLAPVSKALDAAMTSLGLSAVKTREQFKAEINALDLTTEAGAKRFEELMQLAEAFALVHPEETSAVNSLAEARSALTDAYQAESDAIKAANDRMTNFAKSLRALRDSALLGGLSPLTPQQKYLEAKAQFEKTLAAARGGDADAQGRYQDAYQAFLEASKVVNASGAQYQADFAYVQSATEEAAKWAEQQVDVGKASLDALNKQVGGLLEVKGAVLTVTEAVNNLSRLLAASGQAVPTGNQASAIESLYQSILGRASDAGGLEFWTKALQSGVSIQDIAAAFAHSDEYMSHQAAASSSVAPIRAQDYGTGASVALVAEVKALRADNQALNAQVAGLRADAAQQTGDLMAMLATTSDSNADKVAGATTAAVKSAAMTREMRVMPA